MTYARDNSRLARVGIPTVNTVQDLRELVWFSENPPEAVQTLGALTKGDGGGGLWTWDYESSDIDDTGVTLQPSPCTTFCGRWKRSDISDVNVLWYGCKRDGATDDYSALNAAISYALMNGLPVYIPSGHYRVHSTLVIDSGEPVIRGAGRSSLLDFSQIEESANCIVITEVNRGNFADFMVLGRSDKTTTGIAIGDTAVGTSAKVNTFERLSVKTHAYGYNLTGKSSTNRFYVCEARACTRAWHGTAQANTTLISGGYILQCGMWVDFTNSNFACTECLFQTIIDPPTSYAIWIQNTEAVFIGGYYEKKDPDVNFAILLDQQTSEVLTTSLVMRSGHITPDGNGIIRYIGTPHVTLVGMNDGTNITKPDTVGLVVAVSNANAYPLRDVRVEKAKSYFGNDNRPVLIDGFKYNNLASGARIVTTEPDYIIYTGNFLTADVVAGKAYTLVFQAKNIIEDIGLALEQRDDTGRLELHYFNYIPLLSDGDAWETLFLPFVARGNEVWISDGAAANGVALKQIWLYENMYFPQCDPTFTDELVRTEPTTGTWAIGDKVWRPTTTAGNNIGYVCIGAGTPGTWKSWGTIEA